MVHQYPLSTSLRVAELGENEPILLAETRAQHPLKMSDACVLATAIRLQAPLTSFDDKITDAAKRLNLLYNLDD